MAKTKTLYRMTSTWTYVVSGDKEHWEFEGTKRQAELMANHQRSNLRDYGTDIEIKVEKVS